MKTFTHHLFLCELDSRVLPALATSVSPVISWQLTDNNKHVGVLCPVYRGGNIQEHVKQGSIRLNKTENKWFT